MPHPATPDELAAILAPFVNARLSHKRDANGYVIPRSAFVDIDYRGASRIDADIRGISGEGITAFFYNGCELIRWEDISAVTVRGEGSAVAYRVEPAKRRAA